MFAIIMSEILYNIFVRSVKSHRYSNSFSGCKDVSRRFLAPNVFKSRVGDQRDFNLRQFLVTVLGTLHQLVYEFIIGNVVVIILIAFVVCIFIIFFFPFDYELLPNDFWLFPSIIMCVKFRLHCLLLDYLVNSNFWCRLQRLGI